MNHYFIALTNILLIQVSTGTLEQPKVVIPNIGTVSGKRSSISNTVAVYNGIPYAKPPIGDLRWQPPQPYGKFGDRDATKFGQVCMQLDFHHTKPNISENCLFLNVASPLLDNDTPFTQANKTLLPVMVWIHGGAYVDGSSNTYTPDTMVARSNNSIICVTLNYRLNIFGFLAGTAIKKRTTDGSTGNFGIQDQRMAIDWVKHNIGAFGGNGDDITIFGESAGGNSVFNHLTQKESFSLYSKAIIESGVYNDGAFFLNESDKQYYKAIELSSCLSLYCMIKKTPKELLEVTATMAMAGFSTWGPVVDGVSLTDTPENLITNHDYNNKVPIIIGSNRDEMAFFTISQVKNTLSETGLNLLLDSQGIVGNQQRELKDLYAPANYSYPKKLGKFSLYWWYATRIGTDFVSSFSIPRKLFNNSSNSFLFVHYTPQVPGLGACGVRNVARKLIQGNTPNVFTYLFAHPTQSSKDKLPGCGPNATTVGHATEIVYVYNDLMLLKKGEEQDLAVEMSLYWVNFAKTGNPNGNQQHINTMNNRIMIDATPTKWPAYTIEKDEVLRFDAKSDRGIHVQSGLRKKQCDWQEANRLGSRHN
jgi:carboxylesterase type B